MRRRNSILSGLSGMLLAGALTACGDDGSHPGGPRGPFEPPDRGPEYQSCGEFLLDQGETLDLSEDDIECMRAGFTDTGRELTVRAFTTEGDHIFTYYRTTEGAEEVDVIVDWRADRYGGDNVGIARCAVDFEELPSWPGCYSED